MKFAFIGLGRMGAAMVRNVTESGHKVVAYNRSPEKTKKLSRKKGITGAYSFEELVDKLPKRKIVWLMIPAGKPVDMVLKELVPLLKRGDIVIDGGNSWFKDSQRRASLLKKRGIYYLDCGTSGGIEGARRGACMMVGGDKKAFATVENLFKSMCVKNGYGYMGKSGAGHFVKMVHNGIEYGMVGAIDEGMEAVRKYAGEFGTDMKTVAKVYAHGSIIDGKLTKWLYAAFESGMIKNVSCAVPVGETEKEMRKLEKMAPMPVLKQSRLIRVRSRRGNFCAQSIAAMRNLWGGHKTLKKGDKRKSEKK